MELRSIRIEKTKAYSKLAREEREPLIRTFYTLYKLCTLGGGVCRKEQATGKRLRFAVFAAKQGSDVPSDYEEGIASYLEWLLTGGYISEEGDGYRICMELIQEDERRNKFLKAYCVPKMRLPAASPVSVDELPLIRASELSPQETHPAKGKVNIYTNEKCTRENCRGSMVLTFARYGFFFYCDKNCTKQSTRKVYGILYQIIARYGLEVYEAPIECPACHLKTRFFSYMPQMVFETREPKLCKFVDYWGVGVSSFPRLDACLSDLFPEHVFILPPQGKGTARWANICPGCGAVLDGGLEILTAALRDAAKNNSLDSLRTGKTIPVSGAVLPYFEFARVSDQFANKYMRKYECEHRGIQDSEINWTTHVSGKKLEK